MTVDRIQKLRDKKAALEAKIKDLTTQERSQRRRDDTRRKILIGAIALEHMEMHRDAPFTTTLLDLLEQYIGTVKGTDPKDTRKPKKPRPQDRDFLNTYFTAVGLRLLSPLPDTQQPANDDAAPPSLKTEFKT